MKQKIYSHLFLFWNWFISIAFKQSFAFFISFQTKIEKDLSILWSFLHATVHDNVICIALSFFFFFGFVELLSSYYWIIRVILNFQQNNRSSNTLLINNSELETFLPLSDHAHRWQWGMERVMIIRCRRWRQATTTSAGPPHCWRPHQLCKQNSILFIVLSVDFTFTRATLNSKLARKWKSRHRGELR